MGYMSGEWEDGTFLDILFHPFGLRPLALFMFAGHLAGLQGLYYFLNGQIPWQHFMFVTAIAYISHVGLTAGAHRLFSHNSYKATLQLRILLIFMISMSGHGPLIRWAKDHRLHHKHCETDADPHNIRRGVFFSHIGWTLLKKHPKLVEKEKAIDMSDLENDPVIAFQRKYYFLFHLVLVEMLPVYVPHLVWGTPLHICVCMNLFRFMMFYHGASLGNSLAHSWFRKPYDKNIGPADNTWLSLVILGEGWHNYHHVFPWDYRSTDEGPYAVNTTSMFIDLMAKIGWAYDLKTVPGHIVQKRAGRTGDGGWKGPNGQGNDVNHNEQGGQVENRGIGPAPWGWGDKDIPVEDIQDTVIHNNGDASSKKKI